MPLPEREPLAGIVRMRVTNRRAPHPGETGRILSILQARDEQQEMLFIEIDFRPVTYERLELELVMP